MVDVVTGIKGLLCSLGLHQVTSWTYQKETAMWCIQDGDCQWCKAMMTRTQHVWADSICTRCGEESTTGPG